MATDQAPDCTRRFRSDDLPERDRHAILSELVGRTFTHLDRGPIGGAPFRFEFITRSLPTIDIISGTLAGSTDVHTQRTRELIANGNDEIQLMLMDEGYYFASQFGREVVVDAGTAVLVSNADVNSIITQGVKGRMLRIQRKAMLPLASRLEDAFLRPIPRAGEALRLLAGYLRVLEDAREPAKPQFRHLITTHLLDLVALAIGTTRDATEIASMRGLRAARLQEIVSAIHTGFADPGFSPQVLASRFRVTPRYIQELLQESGASFTERVLELRLQQARAMLADPHCARLKIADIAVQSGFNEIPYFNRCFRRRFGGTPTQFRGDTN